MCQILTTMSRVYILHSTISLVTKIEVEKLHVFLFNKRLLKYSLHI